MADTPAYTNLRSSLNTDPIRNFRFLVSFSPADSNLAIGTATFGFTQVSGLTVTTESIPYREGGYNTNVHQIPGQTSFSPLTMTRGVVFGSSQNWNWMKRLFDIAGSTPSAATDFRTTINISVLKHPAQQLGVQSGSAASNVAMRFKVYNAWVTSVAYSDLNAGDNALMVEQMTVVHEGFEMEMADKYTSAAADISTS